MNIRYLILLLLVVTPLRLAAFDAEAFLLAIRLVESNDQEAPPPGAYGEQGAYQFRRMVWKQHTSSPFTQARNRSVADVIAVRHMNWIKKYLERNGVQATPYNIAMAWNAGIGNVTRGTSPQHSRDYAKRVTNLMACYTTVPKPEKKPSSPRIQITLGDTNSDTINVEFKTYKREVAINEPHIRVPGTIPKISLNGNDDIEPFRNSHKIIVASNES